MQETAVVNIYRDAYDAYIGREGKGQDGTFGNPFHGPDRARNIADYKAYFYERLRKDHEFFVKVRQLRGKRLGCFCAPKRCHGDIIAEYLNAIAPLAYGIIGSRSFEDYQFFKDTLYWFEFKAIISGGASGADSLAERYAIEHDIPFKKFVPNWRPGGVYDRSAGFKRNKLIIDASDEIIAFWDGISKGTKHSIDLAAEVGKPCYIINVNNFADELVGLG